MFIAFDGIDGSGKTTLSDKLTQYLKNKKYDVELFDMGKFGFLDEYLEKIKNKEKLVDSQIRELLFYFEGNLFSNYIKENSEKIIITDRYFLSYYAYGPINGMPQEVIWKLVNKMISPDFYFFINVSPEIALNRIIKYRKIDIPEIGYINKLSDNEEENKNLFLESQNKVYSNYLNIINKFNVHIINGNQEIDKIFNDIKSIINLK
ncbi:MAG: dTMP kinase [Lachnospiraceae bacterium]|nr:dTMP kinase [Lachnospiraceae bacterium]